MSNILGSRNSLPKPKTDRRHSVGASEAQRFAATENFCIFLLRGMQKTIKNERAAVILSPGLVITIDLLCEKEIMRIKGEQALRMENKK